MILRLNQAFRQQENKMKKVRNVPIYSSSDELVEAAAGGQEELEIEGVVVKVDGRRAGEAKEGLLDLNGFSPRPRPVAVRVIGLEEGRPDLPRARRQVVEADEGFPGPVDAAPVLFERPDERIKMG